MNTSGEAAEVAMRMMLEGSEVVIKLTGSGAKNVAVMLYSIYKQQKKTRGSERLSNMLRSGKPLKVYTFKREDLEKFKNCAKEYGVLYTVLKEKNDKDGMFDVLVRADDDSKLARLSERFNLTHIDTATLRTEIEKEKQARTATESKTEGEPEKRTGIDEAEKSKDEHDDTIEYSDENATDYTGGEEKEEPVKAVPDKEKNLNELYILTDNAPNTESPENANPQMAQPEASAPSQEKDEGKRVPSKESASEPLMKSSPTPIVTPPTEPNENLSESLSLTTSESVKRKDGRKSILEDIEKKKAERAAKAKEKLKAPEVAPKSTPVKPKER